MKNQNLQGNDSLVKKIIFLVLLLFSIHFWNLRYIPQKFNPENLITWLACIFCLFMVVQKRNLRFKYAILIFIFGIFLNAVAAYINLGQSPKLTILASSFYYFVLLYFLLHYFELSRKFLETTIIICAIIFSIIFYAQFRFYPIQIVTHGLNEDAGEIQLELLGHGFLMLAYLLLLNRFLIERKLIFLVLSLGFLMIQFKSDFRTLIAGSIFVTALMFLLNIRSIKDFILLIVATLIFWGFMQYKGVTSAFIAMRSETKENLAQGDKYIRNIELEYYFKIYPRNISYYLIGGGRPAGENLFTGDPANGNINFNIVWVDIGLLGFYMVMGGVALLGLIWYTFKAIFTKLPRDRLYLNLYFVYLLIVSFTNEEIYDDGIFTIQAIALYLIDITLDEKSQLDSGTIIKNPI
jgi:hypothetical protein